MCFLAGVAGVVAGAAHADVPATFIAPLDGQTSVDPGQPIRWSTADSAISYYLYVGTTAGSKDLVNFGETAKTQYGAFSLPAGKQVFARLYTKFASGSQFVDISFTLRNAAAITKPALDGAQVSPDTVIEWSTVPGAQAYYIYVGTQPGFKDVVNSGEIPATQYQLRHLPAGKRLYIRVSTKTDSKWQYSDRVIDVLPLAVPSNVQDGATDVDPQGRLSWVPVDGAEGYYLYVGTSPGKKDLVDTGQTPQTSWSLLTMPAGQLLYARLYTKFGGTWRYIDFKFTLRPVAVFLMPTPGATNVDPRQAASWTEVPGATSYYLIIGTAVGARDLVDSGEIHALSASVRTLPRGRTLYARLYTKLGGVFRYVDTTFSLSPVAVLLDPTDGAAEVDIRQPLKITPVGAAQAYYLYAGSSKGANDLIDSGETTRTAFDISVLPAGKVVYLRLYTKADYVWRYVETAIRTRAVATLLGAAQTSGVLALDQPLSWNAVDGADRYYVIVGTTQGERDLADSGELATNLYRIPISSADQFPALGDVWLRLYTRINGVWTYVDYQLVAPPKALLSFPARAATAVETSDVEFAWSGVDGAQAYYLYVGTARGLRDVVNSGEVIATHYRVPGLPGGGTLYARIYTKVDGTWRYSDSSFVTRAAPALVDPRNGQLGALQNDSVRWTKVYGATAYRLAVGTTPGGADQFDSGAVSSTAVTTPTVSADGVLYGRVSALKNGIWRFTETIFTKSTRPVGAQLLYPSDSGAWVAGNGITWRPTELARSYRLLLGTAAGGSDLLDTGEIKATRRYAAGLHAGTRVFGTLITNFLDGGSMDYPFSFAVEDPSIDWQTQWKAIGWAATSIRGMAGLDNVPVPNSILADVMRANVHESVTCLDYAQALLALIAQAGISAPARQLAVVLNLNAFDSHTLVEVQEPDDGRWVIIDPTFAMYATRATNGALASATDLATATINGAFWDIEYHFVDPLGQTAAYDYYIDYPLLFANVYAPVPHSSFVVQSNTIAQFYEYIGESSEVEAAGSYAVKCPGASMSTIMIVDGSELPFDCSKGIDGFARVAKARQGVAMSASGASYTLYRLKRFIFK